MRSNFLKILFLLLFLPILMLAQSKEEIVSGDYENLLLGISRTGVLTGYFSEGTGSDGKGGSQFNCVFFIRGEKIANGQYRIKTWFPGSTDEIIGGEIKYAETNGKKGINLHLDGEHGGCWNVAPVLKEAGGVDYDLTSAGIWQEIRVISPSKAYFYKSADAKAKLKTFVVRGDGVRVFRADRDWAEVSFVNDNGKTTKGWLQIKDFFAAAL